MHKQNKIRPVSISQLEVITQNSNFTTGKLTRIITRISELDFSKMGVYKQKRIRPVSISELAVRTQNKFSFEKSGLLQEN